MKQRKNAGSDKHNGRNNNKASKLSVPPSATQQERANDEIKNQVPVKQSMRELLQPEGNKEAFNKLFVATIAMLILPVLSYFVIYYASGLQSVGLDWAEGTRSVAGGVAAIVVVNLVIAAFVISAFLE